jgi:hypothetical protein
MSQIVSEYDDADLEEESSEEFGDMSKTLYAHKDGYKVVRIYQKGKLIQEVKLIPKEEKEELAE